MTDHRPHLRALAEALPAGSAVLVPREWLLELLVEKHRDADSGLVIPFRTAAIGRSLVALAEDTGDQLGPKLLSPNARKALQALVDIELPGQGAGSSDWERAAGIAHGTFNRVRKLLLTAGYVSQEKAKAPWRSTPEGRERVGPRTTEGPRSDHGPSPNGRTTMDQGVRSTPGPVLPDRSIPADGRWCAIHPAIALRPCDSTSRPECPNCSPLLFPGIARVIEGGVVIEAEPGRPAADSVSGGGA
jgi:hypothetical protein